MTERFFSLNAALMPRATTSSIEGTRMAGAVKKLVCCLLLLALAGTAFAGYGTAVMADRGAPAHNQVTGSHHGDRGLLRVTGDPGKNNFDLFGCYYRWITCLRIYVCIMVCKIGGGGDSCPHRCEAALRVCG